MIKGYLLCCLFSPLTFHDLLLFSMLTQELLLICRKPKGQTQNPLGYTTLEHTPTCLDTWMHKTQTCARAQSLANNTVLSSFISPMHRCRACSGLMKNNLSKSVVALRQPFSPNVTFKGGSLLTRYCSKATEPRNCLGQLNEVPIMNAMIKCPLVQ